MAELYNQTCFSCSKIVTERYSTSFSLAVNMLDTSIREAIYGIYGFVRIADEIVDSFHEFDKEKLILDFEQDYYNALREGISTNPILQSFQLTVKKYNITDDLVQAFLSSMKSDLFKQTFSREEFTNYVYGSADVVGLMCLKVFVGGNEEQYEQLKPSAMRLGSAFQKVNFLRDLKDDVGELQRSYFPNIDLSNLSEHHKHTIIREIEDDFDAAYKGIKLLPSNSKFGVYTAYRYYLQLLKELRRTPASKIITTRIRVSNISKIWILIKVYIRLKLKSI
jgi:phytoene/squalene synthetase